MFETIDISGEKGRILRGRLLKPQGDQMVGLNKLLIIFSHGFPLDKSGHKDIFSDLAQLLRDKGFHTLALDFRGCGKSDGRQEDFTLASACKDLGEAVEWAENNKYEHFMFIGEGLGATLPLMDYNESALCFIMLWPLLDYKYAASHIFDSSNIAEQWKKAGYILRDDNRIGIDFIYEMEHTDVIGIYNQVKRPILAMHGTEDHVTPLSQLDLLREHVKSRRLEITTFQDGEHGLPALNHRKSMYYHILQFVEKYASWI